MFENFLSVWPIVNLLWVMISYVLWNSCGFLDGLEIWHVYYRHLEVCHGFGFTHLSCLVSVLWLLQVDAWFDALYELVWVCFGLMNLIDLLPFVQMAWNLVWWSFNEFCLDINILGIYWNVCGLIWIGSFCLVLWGSKLHALYSLLHEMIMVDDMNVRPLGFDPYLIDLDFW